jgi:hypothetical protein
MFYRLLADTIVAFHLAYVAFIVLGLVVILVGIPLRWSWIRNPWFRCIHLLMIVIVAIEAIFGWQCPLTTWEHDLRIMAGEQVETTSFVSRLIHNIMFFDAPEWVFNVLHLGFALVIVGTFLLAPPRFRRPSEQQES